MPTLLLLFIVVPAVELVLLIRVGTIIGALPTLGLIVATGILGATLARIQGLNVLARAREELASGRLPADSIADGLIILLAGAVLITPGILTDIFGFLCLIPFTRRVIKIFLWRRFERAIREGRVHVSTNFDPGAASPPSAEKKAPDSPDAGRVRDVPFEVESEEPDETG